MHVFTKGYYEWLVKSKICNECGQRYIPDEKPREIPKNKVEKLYFDEYTIARGK